MKEVTRKGKERRRQTGSELKKKEGNGGKRARERVKENIIERKHEKRKR